MSVNNSLVALQEQMKGSWAQVETVLQRRYDLIPNLVATVKGYAEHEKEMFENVAKTAQPMECRPIDTGKDEGGQRNGKSPWPACSS